MSSHVAAKFVPEAYLRTVVYFAGIAPETLNNLAVSMIRHTFTAGQTIFLEGDPCAGMWMIETGRVKIYKVNPEGVEHVMLILGNGDTFNDISALDGDPCPANAAALSDCVIWVLPYTEMQTAIQRDSRLAVNVIHALTGRVRGLIGKMENLALYSVTVRLARFLLQQAGDMTLSGPGVTRAVIAAHLATTPQTISTVLKELETTGAIRFNRHEIHITNVGLLKSIAML